MLSLLVVVPFISALQFFQQARYVPRYKLTVIKNFLGSLESVPLLLLFSILFSLNSLTWLLFFSSSWYWKNSTNLWYQIQMGISSKKNRLILMDSCVRQRNMPSICFFLLSLNATGFATYFCYIIIFFLLNRLMEKQQLIA